jgi:hypothetical protein
MRNRPPAHPAEVADERVTLALRYRLAAEQAGGWQKPALHAAEGGVEEPKP